MLATPCILFIIDLDADLQSFAPISQNFTHVKKEKKPKKINNQGRENSNGFAKFCVVTLKFQTRQKGQILLQIFEPSHLHVTNLKMLTTHIFGNAYLRSKLHIGERGKKTLNLIEPISPMERPSSTKRKEKKRCGLSTFLPIEESWSSTKVKENKMSKLHIGKKKNVDAPHR